jgi:hypothetical protein
MPNNVGKRLSYSSATPAAAVFVAPVDPIPDNCSVVRLLVPAGSPAALYGDGAVGAPANEGADCARLIPGQVQDLAIGPLNRRGALVLNYASTGGATLVDIVYLNELGVPL